MITDCPNCSWLFDPGCNLGETGVCPFCGASFVLDGSPYSQLEKFMIVQSNGSENPFCEDNYLRKDYTGWIYHRIRSGQPVEIHKLLCNFMPEIKSKIILETLWNLNFREYLDLSDEAAAEFLAVWIFAVSTQQLSLHPEVLRINLSCLAAEALWSHPIAIQPGYISQAIAELNSDKLVCDKVYDASDFTIKPLVGNPIFDWCKDAPLPMRRALMISIVQAFRYGASSSGYFCLDKCFSRAQYSVEDHGYTTKKLLDSNIFCELTEDKYEKLFSKDEFIAIMNELQLPVKKNFTRRKMVSAILDSSEGNARLKKLVADKNYVMIHPTLESYAKEMCDHYNRIIAVVRAFSSFKLTDIFSVRTFLAYVDGISSMMKEYVHGMRLANLMPAWRFHAVCPAHQYLNGKVFLKNDPVWRKIFPMPYYSECYCHVESVRKFSELSHGEDFNLPPRDFADPVKILESWQNDPAPLIPLPKEELTP